MKPSQPLKSFFYLCLALICISSTGCGPDFGEKLVVNKTEIYYKDGVTQADAKRLGDKLKELNFIDDKPKSVQLLKRDDVWEFRLATGKGGDTEAARNQMKVFSLEISSAFDGAPVEVHICNPKLESQAIVKGLTGECYRLGNVAYYYEDVDVAKVKEFAAIAVATQLDSGVGASFHLSKPADLLEVRIAHPVGGEGDKQLAVAAADAAVAVSNKLFGGKQVDVLVCDRFFDAPKVFSSVKKEVPMAP